MSRLIRYGISPCKVCNRMISNNGMAYASHMRAHVRKGEATEITFMRFRAVKPQPPTP